MKRLGILRLAIIAIILVALILPAFVMRPKTLAGYLGASFLVMAVLGMALTLLLRGWRGQLPAEVGPTGVKWSDLQATTAEVGRQADSQQAELDAIRERLDALDVTDRYVRLIGAQLDAIQEELDALGDQVHELIEIATQPD